MRDFTRRTRIVINTVLIETGAELGCRQWRWQYILLGRCKYYEWDVKLGDCISVPNAEKLSGRNETWKECIKKPLKVLFAYNSNSDWKGTEVCGSLARTEKRSVHKMYGLKTSREVTITLLIVRDYFQECLSSLACW